MVRTRARRKQGHPKPTGATFRKDRPDYAALLGIVRDQGDFDFEEEDACRALMTDAFVAHP